MKAIFLLLVILLIIASCQSKPKLDTNKEFGEPFDKAPNKTIEEPIQNVPKAIDLTGNWKGKFSFTNNCQIATCKYHGKEGSIEMNIVHNTSGIAGDYTIDFTMFEPESLVGDDPIESCPTVTEFGKWSGDFSTTEIKPGEFSFIDQFRNLWIVWFKDGEIQANIDNDELPCMGMVSKDLVLKR